MNTENIDELLFCLKCKKKCEVKDVEIKKTTNNKSYK